MAIIRGALAYFLIVFLVGFALGTIRVLWLLPRVGERYAELMELPVMLAASWLAARFVFARSGPRLTVQAAAIAGLLALALLVLVEFTVVLGLRGLSVPEYLASRDPVAAAAYYLALALFAAFPPLVIARYSRPIL